MEWIDIREKLHITCDDGSALEGMITDRTDDTISFSIPADDRNFRLFQPGEKITGVVFKKNKGVRFHGVIAGRISAEAPTYTISKIAGWKSVQRRNYVRVECSDPMTYTADRNLIESVAFSRDLTRVEDELEKHMKAGMMLDISAGGLKLFCEEDISEGQKIILKFPIRNEEQILRGTVMHKQMIVNPSGIRYFYGIRFDDILEKTQEMIVNYVFQIMRKMGRK
ncbi:flagellar brake protein [Proteiniclasticum sp. C24MP]|uniref:flagellar brake protein n=1 Tax=Proteiniclasticum sp. C24MP TaxID=3374101 RepID=UPI003754A1B3